MTFNKCSIRGRSYGDPMDNEGNPIVLTEVCWPIVYNTAAKSLECFAKSLNPIYFTSFVDLRIFILDIRLKSLQVFDYQLAIAISLWYDSFETLQPLLLKLIRQLVAQLGYLVPRATHFSHQPIPNTFLFQQVYNAIITSITRTCYSLLWIPCSIQ